MIGRLDIDDPEGANFSVSDFSVTGSSISSHFEVAKVGGEFVLKLKDGLTIVDSGGSYYLAGNYIGNSSSSFGVAVKLDETDFLTTKSISFSIDDPTSSAIQLGTDSNNQFTVTNNAFKLIRGGAGDDLLILDGINGNVTDTFDFRSTVSNSIGNSADLKSIERIQLSGDVNDLENTLRMNIADVLDLLRTSDTGSLKFLSPGADAKIEFFDESNNQETLVENGFTDGGSSGGYHTFTHATLGDVLIQDGIVGAAGGGAVA